MFGELRDATSMMTVTVTVTSESVVLRSRRMQRVPMPGSYTKGIREEFSKLPVYIHHPAVISIYLYKVMFSEQSSHVHRQFLLNRVPSIISDRLFHVLDEIH